MVETGINGIATFTVSPPGRRETVGRDELRAPGWELAQ
jgi:hypothetical protein